MFKKISVLLIFFVGCFFIFRPFLFNPSLGSLQSRLQQISQEDKVLIEQFFRILLIEEKGAYVLFGDKPMAVSGFFIGSEEKVITDFFYPDHIYTHKIYRLGWEQWTKYAHLFPSKKFILKGAKFRDDFFAIDLISKERFEQTFQNHENDFKQVLGRNTTFEKLLLRYMNENVEIGSLLSHDGLYGTLLGYGRKNAWLFHQMVLARSDVGFARFRLHSKQTPSPGFKTIEEERDFYEQKLQAFEPNYQYSPIHFIGLPGFRVDAHSEETQELRKKYAEQRKKIAEIYRHGNFLEIALSQFTSS